MCFFTVFSFCGFIGVSGVFFLFLSISFDLTACDPAREKSFIRIDFRVCPDDRVAKLIMRRYESITASNIGKRMLIRR